MVAGFVSEWVAGFKLECMAGFVGIRSVSVRAVETCNQAELDGIGRGHEHDRNSKRGGFRRQRCGRGAPDDHGHPTADQVGANAGSRSFRPSAQRNSIATFWPST